MPKHRTQREREELFYEISKRLIANDEPIKCIGFDFFNGRQDSACKFFKKMSGMSMSEFQRKTRRKPYGKAL